MSSRNEFRKATSADGSGSGGAIFEVFDKCWGVAGVRGVSGAVTADESGGQCLSRSHSRARLCLARYSA